MGSYRVTIRNSDDAVALVYLAELAKINPVDLFLLYDRLGKETFFFFFLLAGKQITVPRPTKFLKIREATMKMAENLRGKKNTFSSLQERQIMERARAMHNKENDRLEATINITDNDSREHDVKLTRKSRLPDGENEAPGGTDSGSDDDSDEVGSEETEVGGSD